MMVRFVSSGGKSYRVLLEGEEGSWLIDYEEPAAPFLDCTGNFQRMETPQAYLDALRHQEDGLSQAEQARLDLITPLLEDDACIRNKVRRRELADQIARDRHTTRQRILRLYQRYQATGVLLGPKKPHKEQRNRVYDWAIQTFYYSAKKLSLRASYEMMVAQKYVDENGRLLADTPTWSSFQHYFYRSKAHLQPEKIIAREGLSNYQRNHRQLNGTVAEWRTSAGSYQMDATEADIYLVSRLDRSQTVGRPYIYLAVDTATQLIAGLYVGFEAGETAVMECLAQAAEDKVAYCQRYGISIDPQQWPSSGLPREVITDKGRDFCGKRIQELCMRFGVELQSLPPFRPEAKGLVEKSFDLLQQRYKPLLRGSGIIEEDAQERWATDYRQQAVLNLDEFRLVLLHCVLELNSSRILQTGKTASQEWADREKETLSVDPGEVYHMALPRQRQKLTRRGFHLNGLWYAPAEPRSLLVGESYTLAYDPNDAAEIYVVTQQGWSICHRVDGAQGGVSVQEEHCHKKQLQSKIREGRRHELETGVATIGKIQMVLKQAKEDKP